MLEQTKNQSLDELEDLIGGFSREEEEESASGLGLRDDEGAVDASTNIENDKVRGIGVVKTRDEEVGEAIVGKVVVVDEEVSEEVVDDGGEVFSEFEDSGDKDYRESSEDVVSDGEGGSSKVEVDGSDDEDYKESSGVADDNEEEGLSDVGVNKSDDDGV
ncbi:hypothetical protein B0J14DRAFT_707094 [Halenospora varia]|nr:hypothetical protein B0J14DRAFT_707094 [Halenospora varia]